MKADGQRALGYIVFGIGMTILLIMCAVTTLWCRRKYKQYFQETYPARDVPDILSGELYYGMVSNINDQESSSQYISEEHQKEDMNDSKDANKKRRLKSDRAGSGSQGVYQRMNDQEYLVINTSAPDKDLEREVEEALNNSFGNEQQDPSMAQI